MQPKNLIMYVYAHFKVNRQVFVCWEPKKLPNHSVRHRQNEHPRKLNLQLTLWFSADANF